MISHEFQSAMGAQRTLLDGATGKAIPVGPHLGTRQTEDFGDNAEFKRAEPVVEQGNHQRSGQDWHDLYVYVIHANCKHAR